MIYYCKKCMCKSSRRIQKFNYENMTLGVWFECWICGHTSEVKVYDRKGKFIYIRRVEDED